MVGGGHLMQIEKYDACRAFTWFSGKQSKEICNSSSQVKVEITAPLESSYRNNPLYHMVKNPIHDPLCMLIKHTSRAWKALRTMLVVVALLASQCNI